jgi:hypothetical protein
MEIALNSRARRICCLAASAVIVTAFLAVSTLQFLANFSSSTGHLKLALRLAPEVAEYHEQLGHQLLQAYGNIPAALQQYRLATTLNPHDASYWLASANAKQILNDLPGQRAALQRALEADPTTPDLAWTAANFFLAQGDLGMALREFKVVVEYQPEMADATFNLCTRTANVATILQKVLPSDPGAYLAFISFLTWRKDSAGAAQVWNALVQLGKPFEPRRALPYVDYLISQHDVAGAREAWRQIAQRCGLSAYLNSDENLIVNSHFDSNILNSGFDWRYQRKPNVEVALDPSQFHGGSRSLSVVFDGPGVEDAGIMQYVPVQPDSIYDFSAAFKADAMDGAGGPRFSVQDAYNGAEFFSSDDLRDQDVWHEINGEFRTGANTQLVMVRVVRIPSGRPIKGRLWVDDIRLKEKESGS